MNTNCKVGNLMLMEVKKQPNIQVIIKEYDKENILSTMWGNGNVKQDLIDNIGHRSTFYQPIIICDDSIKIGDICHSEEFFKKGLATLQLVVSQEDVEKYNQFDAKKVIVEPSQLSSKFIECVINEKVKVGDKVSVELNHVVIVESTENYDDNDIYVNGRKVFSCSHELSDVLEKEADKYRNKIKLRNNDTATIHPYSESVEEAAKAHKGMSKETCETIDEQGKFYEGFLAGAKWKEQALLDKKF